MTEIIYEKYLNSLKRQPFGDIRDNPIYGWGISLTADEDIERAAIMDYSRTLKKTNDWKKEKELIPMEAEDVTDFIAMIQSPELTDEQVANINSNDAKLYTKIINEVAKNSNDPLLFSIFNHIMDEIDKERYEIQNNEDQIKNYTEFINNPNFTVPPEQKKATLVEIEELRKQNRTLTQDLQEQMKKYDKLKDKILDVNLQFVKNINRNLGEYDFYNYVALNENTGDYALFHKISDLKQYLYEVSSTPKNKKEREKRINTAIELAHESGREGMYKGVFFNTDPNRKIHRDTLAAFAFSRKNNIYVI